MGKGKKWSAEECLHLSEAWLSVSEGEGETKLKGTSQTQDAFWKSVVELFSSKGPSNPDGVYGDRPQTAIMNHWKDNISRDVKKFNKAILMVFRSKPSGVTEEEKINIAVAIHLKKADSASSRHKDFQPFDWIYYRAWLVLKNHKAFVPPTPEQMEDEVVIEDSASPDSSDTAVADTDTTPTTLFETPTPNAGKSRGPGPGSKKTRAKAIEDEYKNKRTRIQEELLEVQKKRQSDFAMFVNNQAKAQAFKMAVMGYETFKNDDPVQAQRFKETMESLLDMPSNSTAAAEEDMPGLTGNV